VPAIPVMAPVQESQAKARVWEQGDHLYITAPLQLWTPEASQIEELAFVDSVRSMSPNENIVWLRGQYVEADNPNANGARWSAGELALKSLTPRLMPVTEMHDPSSAVGVIADASLLTPDKDNVQRARIDTVLALWGHRFPDAVGEAVHNARNGMLMQSMECISPWYECSECAMRFTKLPGGQEQAMWCDHLKASRPSGGTVDWQDRLGPKDPSLQSNASRILGDVTFTGTGLIYGSRGAKGAFSDAHLETFMAEVASAHHSAHASTSTQRSVTRMGLVQIEDTELANLRKERDDAKAEAVAAKTAQQEAETKVEQAEAKVTAAETAKTEAEAKVTTLTETAQKAALTDERMNKLGEGFVAKLGDTTKANLKRDAGSLDDTAWDTRLGEIEELVAVKRDAAKDGNAPEGGNENQDATVFSTETVASLGGSVAGGGGQPTPTDKAPTAIARRSVAKGLAKALG
jgi:hypothetical protein